MAVVELNVVAKREPPVPKPTPPGGIALEIGKSYYNGNGKVIGPMKAWTQPQHNNQDVLMCSEEGYVYYTYSGAYVGKENDVSFPLHLVSEVWAYEKEEKAWFEGATIEYTDPKGAITAMGIWKPFPSFGTMLTHAGGERARVYMREDHKQLQYRIKP